MARTLLLLGGYGNVGRPLARLLLQETESRVIVTGRSGPRAAHLADALNREFPGERAAALALDAADDAALRRALAEVDMLIVAASTSRYLRKLALAACETQVDYLDLWYSRQKHGWLQALAPRAERAGRCLITGAGIHPGLPATLIRWVAGELDTPESAQVASLIRVDWAGLTFSPETFSELEEPAEHLVYTDGRWQAVDPVLPTPVDMGAGLRQIPCRPVFLGELGQLPRVYPTLQHVAFYQPLEYGAAAGPPYGARLQATVIGWRDGRREARTLRLAHPDGFALTAMAVVACLLPHLRGERYPPGVWPMGLLVDPRPFGANLVRMGADVQWSVS